MDRRQFVATAGMLSVTGCTGLLGSDEPSRLELTVHNERAEPITAQVAVVDDEGTTYAEESDRIDSGVARAFEVAVGTAGRHEVTVSGDDWQGTLAWHADVCAVFDGTVRVSEERIEVASECVQPR